VIQTITTPRAAYWFAESLETSGRSTPDAPLLSDAFSQCGFYFVDSQPNGSHIRRLLVQYILGDPFLKTLRATPVMSRAALQKEHRRQWAAPKKPYGLEIPLPLETTLQNTPPHAQGYPAIAPPFEALHAPTVTPILPPADAPDAPWHGAIAITSGFATFSLDYTGQWIPASGAAPPHALLAFDPQEKTVTKGKFTLTLKPAGSWKTSLRQADFLPLDSAGDFRFTISGAYAGAAPAELVKTHLTFRWNLVPLPYDNDRVITQPWAAAS
jgi:hypothetical protein